MNYSSVNKIAIRCTSIVILLWIITILFIIYDVTDILLISIDIHAGLLMSYISAIATFILLTGTGMALKCVDDVDWINRNKRLTISEKTRKRLRIWK